MSEEKIAIKKRIATLEEQAFNIQKLIKIINDPDFDTYTFTVEASKEEESFKDKQVLKFYDFSTLSDALKKTMPTHLQEINSLIKDAQADLLDLEKAEAKED